MTSDLLNATATMRQRLIGSNVTRISIDYALTLEFADRKPTARLIFEGDLSIWSDGLAERIRPPEFDPAARTVVGLFGSTVESLVIDADGTLEVQLDRGRLIRAGKDGDYESWSYVDDDGSRVICLPSGSLAVWGPRP